MENIREVETIFCSLDYGKENVRTMLKPTEYDVIISNSTGKEMFNLKDFTSATTKHSIVLSTLERQTGLDKKLTNLTQNNLLITSLRHSEQDIETTTDSQDFKDCTDSGNKKDTRKRYLTKHDSYTDSCFKSNAIEDDAMIHKKKARQSENKMLFYKECNKTLKDDFTASMVSQSNVPTDLNAVGTTHETVQLSNIKTNVDILIGSTEKQSQNKESEDQEKIQAKYLLSKNLFSLRCQFCKHVVNTKLSLECHLACVHGIGDFKCYICNKVFAHFFQIEWHNELYHNRYIYRCCVCNDSPLCDKQVELLGKS